MLFFYYYQKVGFKLNARESESARASDANTAQFSFAALRAHALVAALPAVTKTNRVPQNVNATT